MAFWNQSNVRVLLRNPRLQLAALFVLVLLSRLPFLDAGYGANVDAWRVARAARQIAISGDYAVSRFPGYPVQEIVCSWLWEGGPEVLNGLGALLSAVAATVFAAVARKLQYRHWWLAGLALAATPIFFVSSVCSKDYIWALAFLLSSLFCALSARPMIAGLFLGLAVGCRVTSAAMALPLALILIGQSSGRERYFSVLKCGFVSAMVAALAFSPVWLRYGSGFFTFYENHARPDWRTILARGTIEIWGSIGIVGLTIALAGLAWARPRIRTANKWTVAALLCAIALYLSAYLRLPDQAGYLLPVVPALLLLILLAVPVRISKIVLLLLLVAPFVELSNRGVTSGAIIADRSERLQTMERIRDFVSYSQSLPGHNTIVVGAWEPQIAVMAPQLARSRNHYAYLLNRTELLGALARQEHVFYLPAMRYFNYRVNGVDLAKYGAVDLHELFVQQTSPPR